MNYSVIYFNFPKILTLYYYWEPVDFSITLPSTRVKLNLTNIESLFTLYISKFTKNASA